MITIPARRSTTRPGVPPPTTTPPDPATKPHQPARPAQTPNPKPLTLAEWLQSGVMECGVIIAFHVTVKVT
jgi:hypothetical protein